MASPAKPGWAIRARGLTKSFGAVTAVAGLDLDIPRSRIYGFLGPNGSGKSTTIRMLCGLLTPTRGEMNVLGHEIPREAEALRREVGYMTQKFSLFEDLTVAENLRFMADIYTMPAAERRQRLPAAIERYALGRLLRQRAGTLSGGQKQRLALAAATLHGPQLLFLDEPTSAVDPENRRAFWEILFDLVDEGTTILVSTHFMDEAERCHSIAILDLGVLVAEGPPELLAEQLDSKIVLVRTAEPREFSKRLDARPEVRSTAQIGATLRVMVDAAVADPEGYVAAAAHGAGIVLVECRRVGPNLEDVFVAATQARKARREEAA